MDQPGKGCQSCSSLAEQEKWVFPCPCSRLRSLSRTICSAITYRVGLLILHTQTESGASSGIPPDFRGDSHLFIPPTAVGSVPNSSGQSEFIRSRNCTPMAFTAKSPPTEPVDFEVVPVTGAAFSDFTMDQLMRTSIFPHPLY